MEAAYLEQNLREYELTKHVSLALLDPMRCSRAQAQRQLCASTCPRRSSTLDYPGHYMRRLKTRARHDSRASAGPYTTVSCRALADGASISRQRRRPATAIPKYVSVATERPAVRRHLGPSESDRHQPRAERRGPVRDSTCATSAICRSRGLARSAPGGSSCRATFPPFDYQTITDVVLHLRYTARDGGSSFRALGRGPGEPAQSVLGQSLQKMRSTATTADFSGA